METMVTHFPRPIGAILAGVAAVGIATVALRAGHIATPVSAPVAGAVAHEYIVHWPEGTARALADMDGVTIVDSPGADELAKLGAYLVRVDDATAIAAIMAAGAEYVEPNATYTARGAGAPIAAAADPLLSQQWYHDTVGTARAWASTTGAGVRVAVVDSGVGPHPDIPVLVGRDFTGGDGAGSDVYGHGTHVAGICCARRDNGQGGAGVAPDVEVIAARVLDSGGTGSNDGIAAGIVWAADQGAKIINLSLGGPSPTRSLREALAYAVSRGALPICAAGNDGSARPDYPAAFDDCLSVAATDRGDMPARFTNRHQSVDIAAPGVNILSACRGNTYCRMDGTSMAAPIVSGVAALVLSQGALLPPALSWRLRSTAAARPSLPSGKRVDAAAALAARPTGVPAPATLAPRPTAPHTAPPLPGPSASPTAGGVRIIPIAVPPGCRIVVVCEPYP